MVSLLQSLVGFIKTQRTEFEHFHKRGIILCGHDQYNSVFKRVRVPNRRYVDVDDEDEDPNMTQRDRFRQDVFQVINYQLISDLKYRLEAYKEISYNFGFLCKLLSLSSQMIKEAARIPSHTKPSQTFPNIEIALRIYLSLMVSNCSCERSFSKLKRIKNELRNRIG